MVVLPVSETMTIQSHKGPYTVTFGEGPLADTARFAGRATHVIIDATVARLYGDRLGAILERPLTVAVEAHEDNKSLEGLVPLFHQLVSNGVRRDHTLVAIGGGIIQDATCFVASTLLRGVRWEFVPTTLLAQADSCIGSKSSVNLGGRKNLLGNFYPPAAVYVETGFLDTLELREIRSGIGEIAKVHAIDGVASFDLFAADFDAILTDRVVLQRYIRAALTIKQRYIELDEFDQGIRNIFNYGHSFGHAIESASHYVIPHGIAVAMGMDCANALAVRRGLTPPEHHARMHGVLRRLYGDFAAVAVDPGEVVAALMTDKKNTTSALGLILPIGPDARIERMLLERDQPLLTEIRNVIGAVFQ